MLNTWCLMATAVALADGFETHNCIDLMLSILGLCAALVFPPIVALGIAILVWIKVSLDRPLMPLVAAGTLALCILAI